MNIDNNNHDTDNRQQPVTLNDLNLDELPREVLTYLLQSSARKRELIDQIDELMQQRDKLIQQRDELVQLKEQHRTQDADINETIDNNNHDTDRHQPESAATQHDLHLNEMSREVLINLLQSTTRELDKVRGEVIQLKQQQRTQDEDSNTLMEKLETMMTKLTEMTQQLNDRDEDSNTLMEKLETMMTKLNEMTQQLNDHHQDELKKQSYRYLEELKNQITLIICIENAKADVSANR